MPQVDSSSGDKPRLDESARSEDGESRAEFPDKEGTEPLNPGGPESGQRVSERDEGHPAGEAAGEGSRENIESPEVEHPAGEIEGVRTSAGGGSGRHIEKTDSGIGEAIASSDESRAEQVATRGPFAEADEDLESSLPEAAVGQLDRLGQKLDRLLELMENRLKYDAAKEKIIQRMGEELEAYRTEEARRDKRPLLTDLILLYDNLRATRSALASEDSLTGDEVDQELDVFSGELIQVLLRQGVEPYTERPRKLDPRRDRALKVQPTAQESKDKEVVEVVRRGFLWHGDVLRPEHVVIKRYSPEDAKGD